MGGPSPTLFCYQANILVFALLDLKDGVLLAGVTRVFMQPDMVRDSLSTKISSIDKHNTSSVSFLLNNKTPFLFSGPSIYKGSDACESLIH
jgi:hypothetical protein